ncbi:MAG: hypothetical protein EOO34_00485 [Cyanobacteriota bacterium]|nr:MAG: hypothetical protein EOO34_00485 [Cyanobacteriota bacterium]
MVLTFHTSPMEMLGNINNKNYVFVRPPNISKRLTKTLFLMRTMPSKVKVCPANKKLSIKCEM